MKVVALVLSSVLAAANSPVLWSAMSPFQRQHALTDISHACGTPQAWLKLRNGKDLHIKPSPQADFRQVQCVLDKINAIQGAKKMGFVGNETYDPEIK